MMPIFAYLRRRRGLGVFGSLYPIGDVSCSDRGTDFVSFYFKWLFGTYVSRRRNLLIIMDHEGVDLYESYSRDPNCDLTIYKLAPSDPSSWTNICGSLERGAFDSVIAVDVINWIDAPDDFINDLNSLATGHGSVALISNIVASFGPLALRPPKIVLPKLIFSLLSAKGLAVENIELRGNKLSLQAYLEGLSIEDMTASGDNIVSPIDPDYAFVFGLRGQKRES